MLIIAVEVVGWAGAVLILAAYALVTAGKLLPDGTTYQAMNVVGAAGFAINGWWHGALPSAVLNIVWMGIGVFALLAIRKRARRAI